MLPILIVDDGTDKYSNFRGILDLSQVSDVRVDHAISSKEARSRIREQGYAIVIVDLFLPLTNSGDTPLAQNGIDLLTWIESDRTISRPHLSTLITREQNEGVEIPDNFNLLECGDDDYSELVEFNEKIKEIYRLYRSGALKKVSYNFDYLIFTAINIEAKAWNNLLDFEAHSPPPIGCSLASTGCIQTIHSDRKTVAIVCSNDMGPLAASTALHGAIEEFKPRLIVMTGVCGGITGAAKLGDLVIATEFIDYLKGKYVENNEGEYELKSDSLSTTSSLKKYPLLNDSRNCKAIVEKAHKKIDLPPISCPEVLTGPVVSGCQVIASSRFQEEIKDKVSRKVLAIEMEGSALGMVCDSQHSLRPDSIMIKSVCDLADKAKNDALHPYAAQLSANFAFLAIQNETL